MSSISISQVRYTYCFVEVGGRLAQVVRLAVQGMTDEEVVASLAGAGMSSPAPWRGSLGAEGEDGSQTIEVPVVVEKTAPPGARLAVVARLEVGSEHLEVPAEIVVREPGWTMHMVSHFHYDPVWWNTQAGYTSGWDELVWARDYRESFQHSGLALVQAHIERARLDPLYRFVLVEVDYLKPFWDLYPDERGELRRLLAEEPTRNRRLHLQRARYQPYWRRDRDPRRDLRDGLPARRAWRGPEEHLAARCIRPRPELPCDHGRLRGESSAWARGPSMSGDPNATSETTPGCSFPRSSSGSHPNGASLFTSYMPNHYSAGWWFDDSTSAEQAMERAYDIFEDLARVASTKHTLLPAGTDYTPPNRWVTAVEEAWARRYVWPRFVTGLPKTFFAAVRAELAVGLHPPLDAGFRSRGGMSTVVKFVVEAPGDVGPLQSWVLCKVMYFGRLWYSPAVAIHLGDPAPHFPAAPSCGRHA